MFYFALYLVRRENHRGMTVVRKLQDFESPFTSQKSDKTSKLVMRKWWVTNCLLMIVPRLSSVVLILVPNKQRPKSSYYSNHLNNQHPKSEHSTFHTLFCPVFKWFDQGIMRVIWIPDVWDQKRDIFCPVFRPPLKNLTIWQRTCFYNPPHPQHHAPQQQPPCTTSMHGPTSPSHLHPF